MNNNETQQQMNIPNPNLQMNNPPGQPVVVVYQTPPGVYQAPPVVYQAPPVVYPTPQAPQPNVIVIEEGKKPKTQKHSDNCCYCKAPRQSACGCLNPDEYYCCFLIVGNYILLALQYILACLCIVRLCQVIF